MVKVKSAGQSDIALRKVSRLKPGVSILMAGLGVLACAVPASAQTVTAVTEAFVTARGQTVAGNLGTNDLFPAGSTPTFTVQLTSGPNFATGSLGRISPDPGFTVDSATGAFSYTAQAVSSDFADRSNVQRADLRYELSADGSDSSTNVAVYINPEHPPFSVVNDNYTVREGTPTVIQPYANDNPLPASSSTTWSNAFGQIVVNPVHGTLSRPLQTGSNGSVTPGTGYIYTPAPGFTGTDSFIYQLGVDAVPTPPYEISRNNLVATVNINVVAAPTPAPAPTPAAEPPNCETPDYCANNDVYGVYPAQVLTKNVTDNDNLIREDVDHTDIQISVALDGPAPAGAEFFILNRDGSFNYVPKPGVTGVPDEFRYRLLQTYIGPEPDYVRGEVETFATVKITQTTRLVADQLTAVAGQPTPGSVTGNDYLLDMSKGVFRLAQTPPSAPAPTTVQSQALKAAQTQATSHGSVTFNDDGTYTYTADPSYSGMDTFHYDLQEFDAQDNLLTTYASVPVTITVQAAPVEPPVEPPIQPPVEPPVEPPVQPPVEPPVQPPVGPGVSAQPVPALDGAGLAGVSALLAGLGAALARRRKRQSSAQDKR